MNATTPQETAKPVITTEKVEEEIEVSPLDMIEMLSEDLTTALTALRAIIKLNPAHHFGGPNNKNFGKRFKQCFEEAQHIAHHAVDDIKENNNE